MPVNRRHPETGMQSVLGNPTRPGIQHASLAYHSASGQRIAPRRTPSDQKVFNFRERGLQAAMPCLPAAHQ
jgi:hypothetical protein